MLASLSNTKLFVSVLIFHFKWAQATALALMCLLLHVKHKLLHGLAKLRWQQHNILRCTAEM